MSILFGNKVLNMSLAASLEPLSQLVHRGGASGVTGSCHQLLYGDHRSLLIDCGLFQGEDAEQDEFKELLSNSVYGRSGGSPV